MDTNFRFTGSDDNIQIEAFDDPKVEGVTCHLSRAVRGKTLTNVFGLFSEDSSDASIACRQVGPITFKEKIDKQEQVFKRSQNILFKSLKVIRFVDTKRNTLIYLTYSDKIKDGSPKNSISTVPVKYWGPDMEFKVEWTQVLKD